MFFHTEILYKGKFSFTVGYDFIKGESGDREYPGTEDYIEIISLKPSDKYPSILDLMSDSAVDDLRGILLEKHREVFGV